jgi:hypothetical protein
LKSSNNGIEIKGVKMLKQLSLAVSALAMLTVTAGAADMPTKAPRLVEQPQKVSGYVELYGGWARSKMTETECFGGACFLDFEQRANGWALGGAGRATWWWAPNYSIQLDAQGEGTSYKINFGGGDFQRASSHSYLIGGHANWRDPGRGLLGVFGGAGDATNVVNFSSIRHGLIGVEGQLYWGPVTLYAQGGYDTTLGQISSGFFDSFQAWFVRGTARLYVNPNFRLEGTVLYADGDIDYVPAVPLTREFETWLWRAKAEYKFATAPFSLFAAYEGSKTTTTERAGPDSEILKITDHRILGGIRLYLNENTLQFNDRNGTTLDIIAPFSAPSFIFTQGAR